MSTTTPITCTPPTPLPPLRAPVRIGGASGFWGDSSVGAPQLLRQGGVDVLVFDYLAELTLAIMAGTRARNPQLGYATDFVDITLRDILPDVARLGTRIISNAGGLHPQACAAAAQALATELGLTIRIAVVLGDDVMPQLDMLRRQGITSMDDGLPLPSHVLTANAYLGAEPIRQALDAGAQMVITGRCVDSAVTLGVLMHAFDWRATDLDHLAQGSLAGHLIECGCQVTGGLHTDWETVPDWAHIGYPVLECEADGQFVVTKPPGTGGLVTVATCAEQLLYEIGDPARYRLPDVVCDFTQVQLTQAGPQRVRVSGARGAAPSGQLKVSATWMDGFRCTGQLTLVGLDAVAKAKRTGEAILERTSELLAARGWAPYGRTHLEILGSELSNFGPQAQGAHAREVVLRLSATHARKDALALFAREIAPAGTSWSPGTTGADGRPSPTPCIRQYAFLISQSWLTPHIVLHGRTWAIEPPDAVAPPTDPVEPTGPTVLAGEHAPATQHIEGPCMTVPLIRLAWARSGDKGNTSNIGVIARQPAWLPLLRSVLTTERVAHWLGHRVHGPVERFDVPGIHALNFVCANALDGGGMTSLRNDPLGKGMAQILLTLPVEVPAHWRF